MHFHCIMPVTTNGPGLWQGFVENQDDFTCYENTDDGLSNFNGVVG